MTTHPYEYLLPDPDRLTQDWWDAVRRHELVIQECGDCHTLRHPPLAACPNCGSERIRWRAMSGRATLYSYVVVHQTALPSWRNDVPYNIVMVALDEAPQIRLYGNIVGFDDSQLTVGLPVVAVFDDVTPTDTIIRWRVDDSTAAKPAIS